MDDGTSTISPNAFRRPPHSVEAEKALLGAVFVNNRAYEKVADFLHGEHFVLPEHGRIFDACARLIERGQLADPVTLKRYFDTDGGLLDIGGPAYLAELADSAVTVVNAGEYGRLVHDLFLRRRLIGLGEDLVNRAYDGDVEDTAEVQIEAAEQGLYDLAAREGEGGPRPVRGGLLEAIRRAEVAHRRDGALAGISTGLADLDALLGGLAPANLVIVAGRPAMGKTALATGMAWHAARRHAATGGAEGAVVGFFSLEMSAAELAARLLAMETGASADRMRRGRLSNDEFAAMVRASQEIAHLPLFIDDTPALTIGALRTRARRLKREHGLGLVVVDYLQLMEASRQRQRDGRVQEVSEVSRGLKMVAKELDVPVVALSQLSRQVEARDPPRPKLSDLRESGTIEQDADVVMFVYREAEYHRRKKPERRTGETREAFAERMARWEETMEAVKHGAEVLLAKHRHGPTGDVDLHFDGERTLFSAASRDREEGE